MPLLRPAAPSPDQAAASARVRSLLTVPEPWVLPPAPEDLPLQEAPPGDEPQDEAPGPPARSSSHVAPGVLERLRAGRLDPGRRAVAGLAAVGVLAALLAGVLVLRSAPQQVALPAVTSAGTPVEGSGLSTSSAAPSAQVVVAVSGLVHRPGLVRLPPGSRVDDALRAAGGLRPGASVGLLNLARKVVDGEQVLVGVEPAPGAAAPAAAAPAGAAAGPAAGGQVLDLNTATAADLDGLPGIGPVLAQRIVDHRTAQGPFRSVDQLREVSGIGEAKYSSLRDRVRV